MSTTIHREHRGEPEPAWDIARLYPDQGYWDESDYLSLDTNHLVEFSDGNVEVLPMPTQSHQLIVQFLSNMLFAFASAAGLGRVLFAPLRVRLRKRKFREPDVVFMLAEHADRMGEEYWIVDPFEQRVTVLSLKKKQYVIHGEYRIGDRATSSLLDGFGLEVDRIFAAGRQ